MKDTAVVLKKIPGYEGYLAGSDGRIYSLYKYGPSRGFRKVPRPLKGGIGSTKKYFILAVRGSITRNKYTTKSVHRLICIAFHGKPKVGHTASHLDGDGFNNRPENLIWESLSDNNKRKLAHGTDDNGFRNSRSVITEKELERIRSLVKLNLLTHKQIGMLFNVSRVFITKIVRGHRYAKC